MSLIIVRERERERARPTEAGVVCEVAVKGFTLGLLAAGSSAAAPQADGDVGGVAVAVVGRYIGAWRSGWGGR